MFKILHKSSVSSARSGEYHTFRGVVETPFFMPVATQGTVKHVLAEELKTAGAQIALANVYHLMLRPGVDIIKMMGGLHEFMDWHMPILTDSGGFQVFSLSGTRTKTGNQLVKLSNKGVEFSSYVDGKKYFVTPEDVLQIQFDLDVDMAVCLDQCLALPATRSDIEKSVNLTSLWAGRTKKFLVKAKNEENSQNFPFVHAVVQGGLDKEYRQRSLEELTAMDFDGYNIGGLSVGESEAEMDEMIAFLAPLMPAAKPRYLMGVGYPHNILSAVRMGIDMFDCVIPSREGRHGRLFFWSDRVEKLSRSLAVGKQDFYLCENINNARFKKDATVINTDSVFPALRNLSKAYLHHLFNIKEPLGMRLATLHNLEFYLDFMKEIRNLIRSGRL